MHTVSLFRKIYDVLPHRHVHAPEALMNRNVAGRFAINCETEVARFEFPRQQLNRLFALHSEREMGRFRLILPNYDACICLKANLAVAGQRCLVRADAYVINMAFPTNAAKLSAPSRIERPEPQPLPWIEVGILFECDQGKQGAPSVMRISAAVSAGSTILFVVVLRGPPIVHEQVVTFLRVLQCYVIEPVTVDSLIHQIV